MKNIPDYMFWNYLHKHFAILIRKCLTRLKYKANKGWRTLCYWDWRRINEWTEMEWNGLHFFPRFIAFRIINLLNEKKKMAKKYVMWRRQKWTTKKLSCDFFPGSRAEQMQLEIVVYRLGFIFCYHPFDLYNSSRQTGATNGYTLKW